MKHPSQILIKDYSYDLPDERIAQFPLKNRDQSRLLVYKDQKISEDTFQNITDHLPSNSLLIFNDTRVIPARLIFKNEKDQVIEIFCLEPADSSVDVSQGLVTKQNIRWNCLVGNLKKWKEQKLTLSHNGVQLVAEIMERKSGYVEIGFSWTPGDQNFSEILQRVGGIPLPPYLNRKTEEGDKNTYQTVYSRAEGSVAAPTAGLHFTPEVLDKADELKIGRASVTLHVGAGTFKPVKTETLADHEMHAEWMEVDLNFLNLLSESPDKKIIAVGTTSLRTIESLYWMGVKLISNPDLMLEQMELSQWEVYELQNSEIDLQSSVNAVKKWLQKNQVKKLICRTRILIAPPYTLRVADGLITNFHQPQSTLLLLVSAIVGPSWKKIYNFALEKKFRFLSYGDSSLLLK